MFSRQLISFATKKTLLLLCGIKYPLSTCAGTHEFVAFTGYTGKSAQVEYLVMQSAWL